MRRGVGATKTTTIYAKKYYRRKNPVVPNHASAIIAESDAIYCDEQGEIEIPSLDKQRRMFVVLRVERIVRSDEV